MRNEQARHEGPPPRSCSRFRHNRPVIIDVPPERYSECLQVLHEAFGSVIAQFGITAENMPSNPAFWTLADLERVVARPAEFYAAGVDGRIVGCAFVLPARSRPGTWELRHLAVAPAAGGRGFGEALVVEAERRARAAGATVLRVGIVAANVRLAQWYHDLGFVTVGTETLPSLVVIERLELTLSLD